MDDELSTDFGTALTARVHAGKAPDLAYVPQPSLLAGLVKAGAVKPAPATVAKLVDANWSADWKHYGTVNGTLYAAPLDASVESLVWYSPKLFKANKLTVPQTWDDLITLSDQLAAKGIKPWCAGFASGDTSSAQATGWIDDILLRTAGAAVYDTWVDHTIPFNDPQVQAAFDKAGQILKNEKYVNGGYGGVRTIATTTGQDGGLPVLSKQCGMYRQASSYATQWPKGTEVSTTGDVYAFYLPPIDASKGKPVLGAGAFVAAFSDRPEVRAFQTYLASKDWADARAALGGWASANKHLDVADVADPIQKLSVQLLQDPNATFRFDGSDLMPTAVGAGSFGKGLVDWINGQSTQQVTDAIQTSWPRS